MPGRGGHAVASWSCVCNAGTPYSTSSVVAESAPRERTSGVRRRRAPSSPTRVRVQACLDAAPRQRLGWPASRSPPQASGPLPSLIARVFGSWRALCRPARRWTGASPATKQHRARAAGRASAGGWELRAGHEPKVGSRLDRRSQRSMPCSIRFGRGGVRHGCHGHAEDLAGDHAGPELYRTTADGSQRRSPRSGRDDAGERSREGQYRRHRPDGVPLRLTLKVWSGASMSRTR